MGVYVIRRRASGVRVVLQQSFTDCGLACLAMICDHYGVGIRYDQMLELVPHADWSKGISLRALRDTAISLGIDAVGVNCPLSQTATLGFPLIAHYKDNHYVVVEDARADTVTIVDPKFGRIDIPAAEFKEHYSGHVLRLQLCSRATTIQSIQKVSHSPWQRQTVAIIMRWLRRLCGVAFVHVSLLGGLVLVGSLYLRYRPAVFVLWVAMSLVVESVVCARITEPAILLAYEKCVADMSSACSPQHGLLFEVRGGYRVDDRVRWIAEHTFQSRWSFLCLFKYFWGCAFAATVALILGDHRLVACTLTFASAAVWDGVRSTSSLAFSPTDHSARRFVYATLDRQFLGHTKEVHPNLIARSSWELLCACTTHTVACTSIIWYWLASAVAFPSAKAIGALAMQIILVEWWYAGRAAFTAWFLIAHSYTHLSFMASLRSIKASDAQSHG